MAGGGGPPSLRREGRRTRRCLPPPDPVGEEVAAARRRPSGGAALPSAESNGREVSDGDGGTLPFWCQRFFRLLVLMKSVLVVVLDDLLMIPIGFGLQFCFWVGL